MFDQRKFKAIFGLSPKVGEYKPKEKEFVQLAIDIRLAELAVRFLSECRNEQAIEAKGAFIEDVTKNFARYRKQCSLVEETKQRFWGAFSLAKHFGYKTKKSAREYLANDSPLREVEQSY